MRRQNLRHQVKCTPEAVLGLLFVLVIGIAFGSSGSREAPHVLGAYVTDLSQRTPHQRYNACRAAAALDGYTVPSRREFSFNRVVHGWTADRGFMKAPVSYDGILIDDYGGGVCETSTTLYNAALLAGLPILERHAHTFAPGYAPPGRDAAVAYSGVDLRFRNNEPWPITIRIGRDRDRLICRIEAPGAPPSRVSLYAQILDRFIPVPAGVAPGSGSPRSVWRLKGKDGLRVAVYREYYHHGTFIRREFVSDDTYLAVSPARWQ